MFLFFWVVGTGVGLGVLTFLLRKYFRDEETVTPHWIAQHGLYTNMPRYDPDDPSRLERLRQIARAQHGREQ